MKTLGELAGFIYVENVKQKGAHSGEKCNTLAHEAGLSVFWPYPNLCLVPIKASSKIWWLVSYEIQLSFVGGLQSHLGMD